MFDNQQLGQSNFQQQITYQRALQGQLATTIQSINGVDSAQVELVLPSAQDQLFADNATPASAAVLLSVSSTLDPGSVRGIAQLVTSSVPGLALDKVTITGSGELLWPTGGANGTGGTLSKQDAQSRYDSMMAAQVGAVLSQIVGPGKADVMINADLNDNQATSDTLTYAKKGVPLQTRPRPRRSASKGGGSGGVSGAAGNIPASLRRPAAGIPTTRTRPPTPHSESTRRSPTR